MIKPPSGESVVHQVVGNERRGSLLPKLVIRYRMSKRYLILYNQRMKRGEFEKLVEGGFQRLPQWVREKIKNVAILIEDEPSAEDRKAEGLSDEETLLGLYKGIPLAARGDMYGVGVTMPDTITLYQNPIEEAAEEDKMDVRDVVADTIWHEFAHHFGMDEGEVLRREQQK